MAKNPWAPETDDTTTLENIEGGGKIPEVNSPKALSTTPAAVRARAARTLKNKKRWMLLSQITLNNINKLLERQRREKEENALRIARWEMSIWNDLSINVNSHLDNHTKLVQGWAIYLWVGTLPNGQSWIFYIKPFHKSPHRLMVARKDANGFTIVEEQGEEPTKLLWISILWNDMVLSETPVLGVTNKSERENIYHTAFWDIVIEPDEQYGGH